MYTKKNGRIAYRSHRRQNHKRINNFSNGKNRNKGNVSQLCLKYLKLAKEASSSGDRIQAEYYYQISDHYSRLMAELGLKSFNSENSCVVYEAKNPFFNHLFAFALFISST